MTRSRVETEPYAAFVKRALVALATRAGAEDEIELRLLILLERFIQTCIEQAVVRQRARGIAWSRIALATGKSRQAAEKRWGQAQRKLYTNTRGWFVSE